jgi:hypothetical protein
LQVLKTIANDSATEADTGKIGWRASTKASLYHL